MASTSELPPLILIAGATATGKTALAMELARRIEAAEIVSADSRQVYRGMDIGTAKATAAQRAAVAHHGLDLADPDERFTAADYRRAALAALEGIAQRGRVALLVGGSGLYLRSIAHGLPLDRGDADATIRSRLEARFEEDGLGPLVAELQERDPAGAERIDRRNHRRVIRALERAILSGSASPPLPQGYPAPSRWLGLAREPADHRRAIERRAREQFATGLLEEAGQLRARYPEDLPAFSAMGYREAFDVLAGRRDVEQAALTDARRTWAYARRQGTWFRSEPDITWLAEGEGLVARAMAVLTPFLQDAVPERGIVAVIGPNQLG
ncbi:MAG TPA: tRNA (adenosine(37)-N6)-dimethylallyltransferase MiaA [Candidatus Limnocylindrales bacterium]|nr:tRNA (adenosine(37)-N6)-dimethylallyltransferase MiaA [Candidatus Limnocylindrales bacterium]